MKRVVVLHGNGRIGSFLIPLLVREGFEVLNVSRSGKPSKFLEDPSWNKVNHVLLDREATTRDGTFGKRIAELHPDILIDIRSFTTNQVKPLVESLAGKIEHMIFTGTDWIHGKPEFSCCTEEQSRDCACFGPYGYEKLLMTEYLLREYDRTGLPVTVLHPGHLTQKNHLVTNPQGNQNHEVFSRIKRGETIMLPGDGNTYLHHVHTADVAEAFMCAIRTGTPAFGKEFHVVSPQAITMRYYAEQVYHWFGREPQIEYRPLEEWMRAEPNEVHAKRTEDHVLHSLSCSIEKARKILGWEPRYTSLDALHEVIVGWLDAEKLI